jgi:hypothetical protein
MQKLSPTEIVLLLIKLDKIENQNCVNQWKLLKEIVIKEVFISNLVLIFLILFTKIKN